MKDGYDWLYSWHEQVQSFREDDYFVPNEVYVRATRRAKELGTSRSARFARAVEKELDEEESSVDIIARINAVVDVVKDLTFDFSSTATRRVLVKDDDAKW